MSKRRRYAAEEIIAKLRRQRSTSPIGVWDKPQEPVVVHVHRLSDVRLPSVGPIAIDRHHSSDRPVEPPADSASVRASM